MTTIKELTPLKALERLGVFRSVDLLQLLDKNILQLYIKIKGERLTKIKNLYLESYYGEVYKVKNNIIYYQETCEPLHDVPIKFSENNWQEYGIIDFIGKKEDYEPKIKTIPMKEWKNIESKLKDYEKQKDYYAKLLESVLNDKEHKALEIIKEKQIDMYQIMDIIGIPSKFAVEMYNKDKDIMFQITIEEFYLLKEVLK